MIRINLHRFVRFSLFVDAIIPKKLIIFGLFVYLFLIYLKSTCDVNLLSKLSIIFKEWRVMNNVDRGGVIVLFVL
jgi:hypothetical protein